MKALVFLILAGPAFATPECSLNVRERFFGSNETSYALVRTESDNLCSYYQSKETTWLDEYSKDDLQREKVKSTLLLEVTHTRDASHNDPDTSVPVVVEVGQQDATLALADLFKRYPNQVTEPWSPEEIAKLRRAPSSGILYRNREFVVSDAIISSVIFGQPHPEEEWHLDTVSGDVNCSYLQISVGQDQNSETRLFCIPPQISKRLNDQRSMQPIYLVAGTFPSADEARIRFRELRKSAQQLKIYAFHPEIWSKLEATDKLAYLVVERFSTEIIESGQIPVIQDALHIVYLPMTSERFIERIAITAPAPAPVMVE